MIQIEGVHFRVVGRQRQEGHRCSGNSQDEFAVDSARPVPDDVRLAALTEPERQAARRRADRRGDGRGDAGAAQRAPAQAEAADNFGFFTSDTILDIYHSATNGIFAVLVGVVALSLVVGGVVIMNIMLMVVTERTREIGLRKALGARRTDILAQMLTESVVLSIFGGVVGTVLGAGHRARDLGGHAVPASVEWWSVALGIGITALVGLFFGLYPAMQAAALDPIEALRKE